MDHANYFSPDYSEARERFRSAAVAAGAKVDVLQLDAKGPDRETLTIDIAWLGSSQPRRALIHTSGLHGVEAFAGSAVQLCLLAHLPGLHADNALIFVHVLNPYGMAWLRRTNENNVDLNRNFLKQGEAWSGAPDLYLRLDRWLNPATLPGFDWFYLRATWLALRYGFQAVKQAVAHGQYELPRGLFYGGKELEQGPRLYVGWLRQHFKGAQYVLGLDLHTGLGAWGEEMLMMNPSGGADRGAELRAALDRPLLQDESEPYAIRGGMGGILSATLPGTRVDFLLQELGTYGPMRVLHALREENRWHHFGTGAVDHPSKKALLEALCPAALAWRRGAVELGVAFAQAAAQCAFSEHGA